MEQGRGELKRCGGSNSENLINCIPNEGIEGVKTLVIPKKQWVILTK